MSAGAAPVARGAGPLAILDVHYEDDHARAACVVAADWTAGVAIEEQVVVVTDVRPYRPGAFYERELPCLLAALAALRTAVQTIVVDGYVDLDEHGTPGLGAHLHAHLGGAVSVVGVAKTRFRGSAFATPVLRGESKSPLFVTARGLAAEEAAEQVRGMHGEHRIPTLLGRVDALARGRVQAMRAADTPAGGRSDPPFAPRRPDADLDSLGGPGALRMAGHEGGDCAPRR